MQTLGRALPALIWCALILAGVAFLVLGPQKNTASAPVAARSLPRNTLLVPGDLEQRGFADRYVVAPNGVQKGARLQPSDVADQPILPDPRSAELLLALPINRAAIVGGINSGSKVRLCGKPLSETTQTEITTVDVYYVYCGQAKDSMNCTAIVELPGSLMARVATKGFIDQLTTGELHLAFSCS